MFICYNAFIIMFFYNKINNILLRGGMPFSLALIFVYCSEIYIDLIFVAVVFHRQNTSYMNPSNNERN